MSFGRKLGDLRDLQKFTSSLERPLRAGASAEAKVRSLQAAPRGSGGRMPPDS